jgi:hypothetical protein
MRRNGRMFHTFEPVKSFDQFVFLAVIQLDNISIRKLCGVVSQSLVYFLCSNPIQLGNVPIEDYTLFPDDDDFVFRLFYIFFLSHIFEV